MQAQTVPVSVRLPSTVYHPSALLSWCRKQEPRLAEQAHSFETNFEYFEWTCQRFPLLAGRAALGH